MSSDASSGADTWRPLSDNSRPTDTHHDVAMETGGETDLGPGAGTVWPDGGSATADDISDAGGDQRQAPNVSWCTQPESNAGGVSCPSGGCVHEACPILAPGKEVCAESLDCVRNSCGAGQVCVLLASGKNMGSNVPTVWLTGCIALESCGADLLPPGTPCGRDWECDALECLGVDCGFNPTGYSFGLDKVCISSRCDAPGETCAEGEVQLLSTGPAPECFCVPEDSCQWSAFNP